MESLLKLTSFKHDLVVVDSLYMAFENLKSSPIDLVLLDLSLPDSTGFKTLTTLLEAFPKIPVVVLTGINNEIVGSQSVKAGAQDFLVKGQFDHKILGRSIRYAIQRHQVNLKLKESAKALAISEKRFQEAQEIGKFGNWEMDIVSNKMEWSDEVFKIFKLQPRSISPSLSDYLNYVHSEDKNTVENFFADAAEKGNELKIEHRIIIDGRQLKYISIRAKIYFNEDTEKILLMGVIQDISERKLNEQLQQEKYLNKETIKIKESAITDMGFHIRTPLSSVVNLVHLLEQSTTNQAYPQIIKDLKSSVSDLSLMVNNLLNISLLFNNEIKTNRNRFEFSKFCKAWKKMLELKANNLELGLEIYIDKSIPEQVITDGQLLTQLFYNLADLAFGNKGGTHIKVSIEYNDNNQDIHLTISENGLPLSDEEIKHLINSKNIDNNQSSHQDNKTNAAILNILSEYLNASFVIESIQELNHYSIQIPIEAVDSDKVDTHLNPQYPISVLLVEDHFLNQMTTKKLLVNWNENVSVDIAENGMIALEKQASKRYDIILMDIQMPVMNGIDATKRIRENNLDLPIIALTANASKTEEDLCMDLGMQGYISKPFKPEELFGKIAQALSRKAVLG